MYASGDPQELGDPESLWTNPWGLVMLRALLLHLFKRLQNSHSPYLYPNPSTWEEASLVYIELHAITLKPFQKKKNPIITSFINSTSIIKHLLCPSVHTSPLPSLVLKAEGHY